MASKFQKSHISSVLPPRFPLHHPGLLSWTGVHKYFIGCMFETKYLFSAFGPDVQSAQKKTFSVISTRFFCNIAFVYSWLFRGKLWQTQNSKTASLLVPMSPLWIRFIMICADTSFNPAVLPELWQLTFKQAANRRFKKKKKKKHKKQPTLPSVV